VLPYGQAGEQRMLLWTVSKLMSDTFEMVRNHLSFYHDFSIGWLNDIGETFKRGTLTSSVDTEQRETFTFINGEACLLYSQNWLREHGLVDFSK